MREKKKDLTKTRTVTKSNVFFFAFIFLSAFAAGFSTLLFASKMPESGRSFFSLKQKGKVQEQQTYENKEYKFSLMIPASWQKNEVSPQRFMTYKVLREFSKDIKITSEFLVDVYENPQKKDLSDWIKENKPASFGSQIRLEKKINIANKEGIERIITLPEDNFDFREIFIAKDDKIYYLQPNTFARFPNYEAEKEYKYLIDEGNKDLEEILSSFEFL